MRTLKNYRVHVVKHGHKDICAYDQTDLDDMLSSLSSLDFDWNVWEVDEIEELEVKPVEETVK